MTNEAFDWLIVLCGWVVLLGLGSAALGLYEWVQRHRRSDLLPPPGGRARIYREKPPATISRWGSTR
jgi:hypothetical protein